MEKERNGLKWFLITFIYWSLIYYIIYVIKHAKP